jgi:hypothetical protein
MRGTILRKSYSLGKLKCTLYSLKTGGLGAVAASFNMLQNAAFLIQ